MRPSRLGLPHVLGLICTLGPARAVPAPPSARGVRTGLTVRVMEGPPHSATRRGRRGYIARRTVMCGIVNEQS